MLKIYQMTPAFHLCRKSFLYESTAADDRSAHENSFEFKALYIMGKNVFFPHLAPSP